MVCFLVNRSPSFAIDKKTPEELWSGTPANYSNLKIFGCPTFVHVDNGKLESRSKQCLFLGYKPSDKGYKLWDLETSKVMISKVVIFYENSMLRGSSFQVTRVLIFKWSLKSTRVKHLNCRYHLKLSQTPTKV